MANYKTQQGDMIKEYMQKRAGEHVTANEIMFYFQQLDIEIGMTTIYRHLNKLVKQGLVKKFYIEVQPVLNMQKMIVKKTRLNIFI